MTRREILVSAGGLVLGGLGGQLAFGASKTKSTAAADTSVTNPYQAAMTASLLCIEKGEICINHCQTLLATGDTSISNCLRTALEMVATCRAFTSLAAYQSKLIKKAASLCDEACRTCEKACREHENHHQICKDCAEACASTVKELAKII